MPDLYPSLESSEFYTKKIKEALAAFEADLSRNGYLSQEFVSTLLITAELFASVGRLEGITMEREGKVRS